MGKLYNIARNILGTGGEYISLNDLIVTYPEGVTINGAFIRNYEDRHIPCFTFAEDSTKYFYAVSGDVAALFNGWIGDCNNNIDELADSLRYENIKVRIEKIKTKGGKTYTKAWVVGAVEKPRIEELAEPEIVDNDTGEVIEAEKVIPADDIPADVPF